MTVNTDWDRHATPADPGAIDLDKLQTRRSAFDGQLSTADIDKLFAAVEALREDLAGYDSVFDLQQKRERPWIEAWREATGKHDTLPDYGKLLAWICDRAEAEAARVAELAGALEASLPLICPECADGRPINPAGSHAEGWHKIHGRPMDGSSHNRQCLAKQQVAVLAATPAEALERARAVRLWEQIARAAVADLRRYAHDAGPERRLVSVRGYEADLAKLDALGKEEGP